MFDLLICTECGTGNFEQIGGAGSDVAECLDCHSTVSVSRDVEPYADGRVVGWVTVDVATRLLASAERAS